MNRRERWRVVLDAQLKRWQALSADQLLTELVDSPHVYEVKFESDNYQVEVELLEDTPEFVHVIIAVDDGSLPASISPVSASFLTKK